MRSITMIALLVTAYCSCVTASKNARFNPRRRLCDPKSERLCVKCGYDRYGTPTPEQFCVDASDECPPIVCCDIYREEICFDGDTPVSCARFEVGCPCEEGEVRCGANRFSAGYCTTLCCDWRTEETCFDEYGEPVSCMRYENGPCPSPSTSGNLDPIMLVQ